MTEKLPSFRTPPVVETVLGAQFDRLTDFSNAHLGAFWAKLRDRANWKLLSDDWSSVADAPPVEFAIEGFPPATGWGPLAAKIRLSQDPSARLQIRNDANTRMIQVQNGRLHLNWLRKSGSQYARYATLRPEFDELMGRFTEFVAECGLSEVKLNQWEITYVNHLLKGREWSTPSDWTALFAGLPGSPVTPNSVLLETFDGNWHFEIPPQQGRLHVEWRHVRVGDASSSEALRLALTARGPASDVISLMDGLDAGRRTIVQAFVDITSAKAQEYWERI